MEIGVTLTVYSDDEYRYEIESGADCIELRYIETCEGGPRGPLNAHVSFCSYAEMEAVGKAMIQATKMAKETNCI
jgi:hypothetical protein